MQLPASAFPEPAATYICDNCGRDITKRLHPGRAHCWQAMGPQRYVCLCGKKWLSGAVEWNHLGDWERERRIRDTLALGALSSVASFLIVALAYLAAHATGMIVGVSFIAIVIVILPAVLIIVPFVFQVGASMWRTRTRTSSGAGGQ